MSKNRKSLLPWVNENTARGRVAQLFESDQMTGYRLWKTTGIPEGTTSDVFREPQRSEYSYEQLELIANLYNKTVEWIKTGKSNKSKTSDITLRYREMKVFGVVSAGNPVSMWGEGQFTLPIGGHPKIDQIKGEIYGFIVSGDSFNEVYPNGTPVGATRINYPQQKPYDGDYVIVFFKSEPETSKATVKEFQWLDQDKGSFLLKPKSDDSSFRTNAHSFKEVAIILKVHFGLRFATN